MNDNTLEEKRDILFNILKDKKFHCGDCINQKYIKTPHFKKVWALVRKIKEGL